VTEEDGKRGSAFQFSDRRCEYIWSDAKETSDLLLLTCFSHFPRIVVKLSAKPTIVEMASLSCSIDCQRSINDSFFKQKRKY
jgi:hypothetical protein